MRGVQVRFLVKWRVTNCSPTPSGLIAFQEFTFMKVDATEMEEDTLVELCCLFQNGCKRKNALLQEITHDFNFSPGWYLGPSTFAWPVDFYIPVNGEF